MMRTLTIIENKTDDGKVEYQISGEMPIEEVARALVIIALRIELPKKEMPMGGASEPHSK